MTPGERVILIGEHGAVNATILSIERDPETDVVFDQDAPQLYRTVRVPDTVKATVLIHPGN